MAEIISAATLLFLVMDPLGNIPIFLSVLEDVAPERRMRVLLRELVLAFLVLAVALLILVFVGGYLALGAGQGLFARTAPEKAGPDREELLRAEIEEIMSNVETIMEKVARIIPEDKKEADNPE